MAGPDGREEEPPRRASADEARAFAATFRSLLEWVHSDAARDRNEVVELVDAHLGPEGRQHSVVSRSLPLFEQVNLQTALDAFAIAPGRSVAVDGITIPPHHGSVRLQQLVAGEGIPPLRLSAPPLVDLANGPGSTLACILLAAMLVTDERGKYVVMVVGPSEHEPGLYVDVAGLPVADAQAVLDELDELRHRFNVDRGHVLEMTITPMGTLSSAFREIPDTARADVILPEPVLTRIERHALGVSAHRDALL